MYIFNRNSQYKNNDTRYDGAGAAEGGSMPCLTSVLAVPMGATGTLQKAASLNSFSGRGVSDGAFAGGWKLLEAAARIRFSSSTSSSRRTNLPADGRCSGTNKGGTKAGAAGERSVGELLRASSLPADGIVLSCGAARILPFVVVLMLLLLLPPLGAGANAVAPVALLLASTAGRGLPSELGLLDGGLPREGGWIIRGVSCWAKLTSLFRPPGRPLCKNNRMHSASVKKNKTDERNSNIDGNGHSSAESMLNGGGGGGPGGGNGVE